MRLGYIHFPTWLHPQIIPGLPLRWYGLMYIVAFVVAYALVQVQIRQKKLDVDRDTTVNLFFWGIIGLLVGARLFAVIIYDPAGYYLEHPLRIVLPIAMVNGKLVFTGLAGMSYHGGLVGAVIACILYLRIKRQDILEWGDLLAAGIPLGYTFGRLGNFINGELYGRVTEVPWGVIFPQAEPFSTREPWVQQVAREVGLEIAGQEWINLPRHPSQLYEAFFEGIVLWAILWLLLRRHRPYKGFLLGCYLIGYGLARFAIEYFRLPDPEIGYIIQLTPIERPSYQVSLVNFTTGQVLSAIMVAAGFFLLVLFHRRSIRGRQAPPETRPPLRKLRKKIR
jgi:phosphatidylglycerol:prolipoprotein diacylglycerol transferase